MVVWKDYGNFRRFLAGGGKCQQDLALGFGLALLPVNSLFLTADVTWQAGSVRLLYALLAMIDFMS